MLKQLHAVGAALTVQALVPGLLSRTMYLVVTCQPVPPLAASFSARP